MPDPKPPPLPEPFAPTGPKLTRLRVLPPEPLRPHLFADESRFAWRLALLLGASELAAWAMLARTAVRPPLRGPLAAAALCAWALLRCLRPLWAKLGARAPRPVVAGVLLALALVGQGLALLGPLLPQEALPAALLAAALAALPALGDLVQSHVADAVTVERRPAAFARLEMGQALGLSLGCALGVAFPSAAPAWAAAALVGCGLLVPDLRDRGTPRSTWTLSSYLGTLASPLTRALLALALLLGLFAGLALAGVARPAASGAFVTLLLAPLGMALAARVEPRSPNAITVPATGAAAGGGALLLALAAWLLAALSGGVGSAAALSSQAALAARWTALFALGIAASGLPASVARGAAEMERPLASSLCWSALGAACALGVAALLW